MSLFLFSALNLELSFVLWNVSLISTLVSSDVLTLSELKNRCHEVVFYLHLPLVCSVCTSVLTLTAACRRWTDPVLWAGTQRRNNFKCIKVCWCKNSSNSRSVL
jgi:hypothetical protein